MKESEMFRANRVLEANKKKLEAHPMKLRTECIKALGKNMRDLRTSEKLISQLHFKNITHIWFKDEIKSINRNIQLIKSIIRTEEIK